MKTEEEIKKRLEDYRKDAGMFLNVRDLSEEYKQAHNRALGRVNALEWVLS